MDKKLDTTIELARWFDKDGIETKVTIQQYIDFVKNEDKTKIADFIFQRLHSRYLKPFLFIDDKFTKQFKNGFSIMANCCLLIETLQSFKNGWGDSDRKSEQAFKQFLTSELNFSAFKGKERDFYVNIRCGILHQGETTGGWTVNRSGTNLFDDKKLVVDSITFGRELKNSLKNYSDNLKAAKWDSELWDNFRTKMRKIIFNCKKSNLNNSGSI
ncbi:Uncharacterised protein [Sphingobacterium spiritivorum]|uniref:Apea-like HEPN domain-containing protein n=1 Tax=Sphingobacterium spiritivorum TaxID=258 RepID=A0A380CI95_SPHSI|nr:hypothetical protein [Sphingobacterium spiritivorum]SUJ21046.1 Uncharacterised protein [Sphingobacterium spiritivorum]